MVGLEALVASFFSVRPGTLGKEQPEWRSHTPVHHRKAFMPKQQIRFGVTDNNGHRASTWTCWIETGKGKNDVYLTCRRLGGIIKASFHESGAWHIAFDGKAFDSLFEPADKPPSRFAQKWSRPTDRAPGILVPCRILVPWYSPTVPEANLSHAITWIKTAPQGKAVSFYLVFTSSSVSVTDWPARRSMNSQLVGKLTLDAGDKAWIVYTIIDWQDPPPASGKVRWARGKNPDDLNSQSLRVFAWYQEPTGTIVLCDVPAKVRPNLSPHSVMQGRLPLSPPSQAGSPGQEGRESGR